MKLFLRLLYIGLVWFVCHTVCIVLDGLNDPAGEFDLAIVMGNEVLPGGQPSHRLKARLDKALAMYEEGRVKYILASGGIDPAGSDEAKVMAGYLVQRGVPKNRLLADSHGNTTWESALNAKHYVEFVGAENYVVISQYFHITRAKRALADAGLTEVSGASPVYFEWRDLYSLPREFLAFYYYLLLY